MRTGEHTWEGVFQPGQNSEDVHGTAHLSMGAMVAAGLVTPPAIMGLHLFLLVECQHFRTEQRSDTFARVL